jgi:hypothetical protein
MPILPNFLDDVPDYSWNTKTKLFDVTIFGVNEEGERFVVRKYTIPPRTFILIIAAMGAAKTVMDKDQGGDDADLIHLHDHL